MVAAACRKIDGDHVSPAFHCHRGGNHVDARTPNAEFRAATGIARAYGTATLRLFLSWNSASQQLSFLQSLHHLIPSNVNMGFCSGRLSHARIQRHGLSLREMSVQFRSTGLGKIGLPFSQPGESRVGFDFGPQSPTDKNRRDWAATPFAALCPSAFEPLVPSAAPPQSGSRGPRDLWDDTFVRYHEPHIGIAAVQVFLEAAGYKCGPGPKKGVLWQAPPFHQGAKPSQSQRSASIPRICLSGCR